METIGKLTPMSLEDYQYYINNCKALSTTTEGGARIALDLGNGTIMKVPSAWYYNGDPLEWTNIEYSRAYCEADTQSLCRSYLDEPVVIAEYYECFLTQSIREAIVGFSITSPIVLPILQAGYTENGIFYLIYPKIDKTYEMLQKHMSEVGYSSERLMDYVAIKYDLNMDSNKFTTEVLNIHSQTSIQLSDLWGNWGIWGRRVVVYDCGIVYGTKLESLCLPLTC